jgi:hypothetical protein
MRRGQWRLRARAERHVRLRSAALAAGRRRKVCARHPGIVHCQERIIAIAQHDDVGCVLFSLQRRFSGHLQVWLQSVDAVLSVFSGCAHSDRALQALAAALADERFRRSVIALQVPSLALLLSSKQAALQAAKCAILVWCLKAICCVATPIVFWWLASSSPLHHPPPPPPLPPSSQLPSLSSALRLCAVQDVPSYYYSQQQPFFRDATAGQQSAREIFIGTTYCMEHVVYNLPLGATLASHALYSNGSAVPLAAGARHAQTVRMHLQLRHATKLTACGNACRHECALGAWIDGGDSGRALPVHLFQPGAGAARERQRVRAERPAAHG